ncbi:MAG: response regulator [Spirochaetales bacterium]|nr:response regulator [Spirochaetales bacterium]
MNDIYNVNPKKIYRLLFIGEKEEFKLPQSINGNEIKVKFSTNLNTESLKTNPPDLILTRETAGNTEGEEIIFAIQKEIPEIPVVMIMAAESRHSMKNMISSGAFDYIHQENFKEEFPAVFMKFLISREKQNDQSILVRSLTTLAGHLQEKNTVFSTILDILSHDTKNLFLNINSLIQQLPQNPAQGMLKATFEDLYNGVMEAINYMNTKPRITSLVRLINEIRVGPQAIPISAHKRIQFHYSSKITSFVETSFMLKNAITNIIENALKFSPNDKPVIINLAEKDNHIVVSVQDFGPGIPDNAKSDVFKRNFRAKATAYIEGSGKGLWITQNIINKEKGALRVEDSPAGGSIFIITLPAFRVDNYQKSLEEMLRWYDMSLSDLGDKEKSIRTLLQLQGFENHPAFDSLVFANLLELLREEKQNQNYQHYFRKLEALKRLNPEGKSVLIVDDSIHVHYYLANYLTEMGYKVINYAKNGQEGLSYYQVYRPDIVTMDFTMPIMTGLEAARQIYQFDNNARILFLSGLGDHQYYKNQVYRNWPGNQYRIITKPVKRELLQETIKDLIESSSS